MSKRRKPRRIKGWLLAAAALTALSAAAAQSPPRSITVKTEPNASVWIDGVLYGKANADGVLTIKQVDAGRRQVRVRADGFAQAVKTIPARGTAPITIALNKTEDPAELAFQEAEKSSTVDRAKAAAAYRKAIEIKPAFIDAHIGLVRVLLDGGDFSRAEEALKGARRLGPANAEISAIEGRFFKSVGEEDKAIAAFKRAITQGAGFQPEAYAGLGLLYKDRAEAFGSAGDFRNEAANYTEAAKYLSTSIKQLSGAPESVVIYQMLGLIYETQNKNQEAIALYREFLRLFPGHPESAAFESFIVQLQKQ
ncbi:MAG: tetratricopeptide repeat protein [Chloracidobacterium sp.]|nr:tetratricopeptide repeat protein [Chloracidobacterium sp.]